MATMQTAAVGALKPATAALLAGVGVVEAATVAEVGEAVAVALVMAVVRTTEELAGAEAETMEREATGLELGAAVEMTETKDCVTTGPVVPVRVKGAE